MKPLNKSAARTLEQLTAGLGGEGQPSYRKLDNASGVYMPVSIDALRVLEGGAAMFSVAHNFIQNGDVMGDPDMVFLRSASGEWYPTEITQAPMGVYRRVLEVDERGTPTGVNPRGYADLVSFAQMWMRNIWAQQDIRASRRRKDGAA